MHRRMRGILSWIIVPAVMSAVDAVDLDHQARSQEALQHNITLTTERLAKEIREFADELSFNNIVSTDELHVLRSTADTLERLANTDTDQTMRWVESQLAAARGTQAKNKLGSANIIQTKLFDSLEKLYEQNQKKDATSVVAALRDALKKQEDAKKDTEKLDEQTVGMQAEEMTPTEKSESKHLFDREQHVIWIINQAISQLKTENEQATKNGNTEDAQKLTLATHILENRKTTHEAELAATDITNNRLSHAQGEQDNVIAILNEVIAELTQSNKLSGKQDPSQPTDPRTELQNRINQITKTEEKQQRNLNETKKLNKNSNSTERNEIQRIQSEIANNLQPNNQTPPPPQSNQAENSARQAQRQIGNGEQAAAQRSMQEVLNILAREKQGLQQQLNQTATTDNSPIVQSGSSHGNVSRGIERRGVWNVALEPVDREVLLHSTGERFPDRYEQQLTAYYHALSNRDTQQ